MIRSLHRALAAALLGLVATPGFATETLIRNATVHTVDSAGSLTGTDVLIREGRIAAIGQGLQAGVGAVVVEAGGRPLTPGLFGGMTGLGIEEISLEPSTVDQGHTPGAAEVPLAVTPYPEFDVRPAFNPDSVAIGVNRVEGISFAWVAPSARPGGTLFAGLGGIARLDGRRDAFTPGSESLLLDLGADTLALSGNSRAAQYMLLEQAYAEAVPLPGMRDGDFRLLTPKGRAVLARHLKSGRLAFEVDRASDIRQVLAFAARTGARVLIVGGSEAWREAAALAAARVPVVLDPLINLPATFDDLASSLENASRLHAAGVAIAFTHFNAATHNAHKVRQAAGNAVAHGLPWEAALAALTRNPAEIFALGDQLGRIAPGMQADLVLWSGDPLEVTSLADAMWIAGEPQSMRSRQTELRDRYLGAGGAAD